MRSSLLLSVLFITLTLLCGTAGWCADWPSGDANKAILTLPISKIPVTVDGKMAPGEYDDAVVLGGSFMGWGFSPRPQSPTVYLKRSKEKMYVCFDNPLNPGERPSMTGATPDNPGIAMGNALELYFMPRLPDGELLKYIQFLGNARGCISDALTTPKIGITSVAEFNLPWEFKNTIVPGHWYAEISIPFSSLFISKTGDGDFFDMDMGRDGGTGPNGVHSYTMAFHQIQTGAGARVNFAASAPSAQWLSFGNFENNAFTPHLRLQGNGRGGRYTVNFLLAGKNVNPETKARPTIYEKSFTVEVPDNGAVEVTDTFQLAQHSTGFADYTITDAQNKTLYYRHLDYTTNITAPPLYSRATAKPLTVDAALAPSYARILAKADILEMPVDKSKVSVEVSAYGEDTLKALASTRIERFKFDYGEGVLELGTMPAGVYTVKFRALEKGTNTPLGYDGTVTLTRKTFEWENNTIGISDTPPKPFIPVTAANGVVKVWGRQYTFTGLGLPASIPTMQQNPNRGPATKDVLGAPVTLVAESKGKALAWRAGKALIGKVIANEAAISGSASAPGLTASLKGRLEYDGFYRITLTVRPTKALALDSLRVEVPVTDADARLFYSVGESMRTNKTYLNMESMKDGLLWDSKHAAKNSLVYGNFLPYAWLGNEDRGIAWMCDSDQGWLTTIEKPCLDLVRKNGKTIFRMHLVNKSVTLTKPLTVVFGLQASPIKARPAGGSWRDMGDYGWSYFDKGLLWTDCTDIAKTKAQENWLEPWYGNEYTRQHKLWWRYFCFNSDRISENEPTYGDMVKTFGAEWYFPNLFSKLQNNAHQDFELWAYKKWHDDLGMSGLYYDNTFPAPQPNLVNGMGWVDETGRVRAGYGLMAYRDFMKRVRSYFTSVAEAPVMKIHMTDAPIVSYLGLGDWWLDGESGGYPDATIKDPDFVDRWYNNIGLTNLHMTLGHQNGTMPMYLYTWGVDPTATVLGMFDIDRTRPFSARFLSTFGMNAPDVEYIPSWDVRKPAVVTAGGPDVLPTIWRRPGRVRMLISNCSKEDRRVTVKLNFTKLGLPANTVAIDDQTAYPLTCTNGVLNNLWVGRHNYRVLLLAAPGTFKTLDPSLGKALAPTTRIEALCDSFDTKKSTWEALVSAKSTHQASAVQVLDGLLCLRTGPGWYTMVAKPFAADNCSVQVKIRESHGDRADGMGPMLALYWEKDKYVRIMAGNTRGNKNFRAEGKSGVQEFGVNSPMPTDTINWVKIALTPTAIDFYCSTDGKTWTQFHTQPRTTYTGAPATLLLGNGGQGKNALFQNDSWDDSNAAESFFDDLIVGKE